jgi:amidase
MRLWLELSPPPDGAQAVLDAYALRDVLLSRWQAFFQTYSIIVMPALCDLPPPFDGDLTLDGQRSMLEALRVCLLAPALGLAGLAVPVGAYGTLRTGVQIVPGRFREDLALDAAEVIEASEGIVSPIDPAW